MNSFYLEFLTAGVVLVGMISIWIIPISALICVLVSIRKRRFVWVWLAVPLGLVLFSIVYCMIVTRFTGVVIAA
jgi:hypothetical protein